MEAPEPAAHFATDCTGLGWHGSGVSAEPFSNTARCFTYTH